MHKLLPILLSCCLALPALAEPPSGTLPAATSAASVPAEAKAPPAAAAPGGDKTEVPRKPIEVRYVTDRLILGMKDNPQGTGKSKKLLKSGMRLEILEKRGAYSLVRAPDGTEGWAKSAFMVKDKPAILRVEEYQTEIRRLKDEIKRLEAGGKRVEIRPDPAQKQRILELEQALQEARTQLRELRARDAAPTAGKVSAAVEAATDAQRPSQAAAGTLIPVLLALLIGLLVGGGLAWWGYDRRIRRRFAGLRV